MREDDYSNEKVMITWLIWITLTLLPTVRERMLNSLTHPIVIANYDLFNHHKANRSLSVYDSFYTVTSK